MSYKYHELTNNSLTAGTIDKEDLNWILTSDEVELLPLLQSAYKVRFHYFQNKVRIHILHNVQKGGCTEDCRYCAQSKESKIEDTYPMKSEDEILEHAKSAYEARAYRHCMVFSGRYFSQKRVDKICSVVKKIKKKYPMDICVSAGFLTPEDAGRLVDAGVNRYNHNLNTSSNYYENICTSHDYQKRVDTIKTAQASGLEICSGVIIGMGEQTADIVQMITELKAVKANSIPVNFFIPVEGHRIENFQQLTPHYCLKILSAFRLAIPAAELRASAGREYYLRSLQPLCLYPANSLFASGYLTIGGDDVERTAQMIKDCGFEVESIEP
ncbi:MAG: biotin synthase BioB [Deltaproteobacteria bacterium]|nr:biotin synthase BioB [Deltaproteobacteria bacterium]